jgi:Flp pilus assembly protein TadG
MNKKILEMVLLTAGLLISAAAMADAAQFSPYSANYDMERKGIGSANGTFTLTKQADGSYEYKSVLHPTGIAALVAKDITQTSDFKVVNGRPQSSSYSYSWQGKPDDNENIQFDWAHKSAAMDQAGKKTKAKLSGNSVDVQLIQLLVATDASAGKLPDSYQIIDKGDATTYTVKTLPDAKLRLQSGNFQTKVVTLTNAAKKRTITAWMAPSLHYLPVQVQQIDKNTVTLTLLHVSYGDAAPAAGTK